MPGPPPKSPDRRQRTNTPSLGVSVERVEKGRKVPPAEDFWLDETVLQWEQLWAHPITVTYDPPIHDASLRRLFTLRDERERFARKVREEPFVTGSQGQPVINPLRPQIGAMDAEIRQLEDRFGLNVASMLKLGINFGAAKRSLDQMSEGIYDRDDEQDPRLASNVIEGTARPVKRAAKAPRATKKAKPA